jgi:hypothetical protein
MYTETLMKEVGASFDIKDYYFLIFHFEKYKSARETLKKEILKKEHSVVFTFNYPKTNFPTSILNHKCELVSKNKVFYDIFKDEQDISNAIINLACDMEENGDYLIASRIYARWEKPLKALVIINEQLRKDIEEFTNIECSSNFKKYVELGREVSFNLEIEETNKTLNPFYVTIDIQKKKEIGLEIKFFKLLIKCHDAILQERKGNYDQVIRIFEDVGVIQNQKICANEALESHLIIERLQGIILLIVRSTLKSYELSVKSSLKQDTYYFKCILQNSLNNIS